MSVSQLYLSWCLSFILSQSHCCVTMWEREKGVVAFTTEFLTTAVTISLYHFCINLIWSSDWCRHTLTVSHFYELDSSDPIGGLSTLWCQRNDDNGGIQIIIMSEPLQSDSESRQSHTNFNGSISIVFWSECHQQQSLNQNICLLVRISIKTFVFWSKFQQSCHSTWHSCLPLCTGW